jgi:cell division transport system ATP-binding protein
VISLSQVCKRYPDGREAVKNATLTIESGELVLLTGHSGAGKTTLLKLISGIERPSSGTVIVNGHNVGALRATAMPYLRRHFGLIFQDHKLLFDRDVFENVALPLKIAGYSRRDTAKRVRAALDKVGLLKREKALPITLSGGEQQRLCIARAIVHRPSILLADEPTGNLDDAYGREIMALFKAFHQVGVTVVIATHAVGLLDPNGLRVLRLSEGEFV